METIDFDNIIIDLIHDCKDLMESDCNTCTQLCILFQEVKRCEISDVPDIMNTFREAFLLELIERVVAIVKNPRFKEIDPEEFLEVISNKDYYQINESDELVSIY